MGQPCEFQVSAASGLGLRGFGSHGAGEAALARERLLGPVGTALPTLPDRLATLRSPRSPYAPRHSGSGEGVQYGRSCGTPRGTSYRTTQMDGSPTGGRWIGARSLALTTRW